MTKPSRSRQVLASLMAWMLLAPLGYSQEELLKSARAMAPPRVNAVEYESSSVPGEVLLSVSVLGAVQRPGVYRIPKLTELHKVIALAGGPMQYAAMDEVTVKSRDQGETKILRVDLQQLLADTGSSPYTLRADDIVMVPAEKPFVSQNTVAALSVVSTILTIIVTSIVISRSRD